MKIIYIANLRMPTERAEGVQTMKTCEALKNAGVDVELWVPNRINDLKEDPFLYYKIKNTFPIIKIPTLDLVKFGRIGFMIHSFTFAYFAKWRLSKMDCSNIYGRDENVLFIISKLGRNTFWESHRGNLSSRAKRVADKAKAVIVITEGLKKLYTASGVDPSKIVVLPDSVDLEEFNVEVTQVEARKRLNIVTNKKVVAYIGLLDAWKGYQTFLDASKLTPEALFVVIGGEKEQIESLCKQYPEVLFLGFLPYRDLPVNQRAADVLVIPNSAKYDISRLYTSPLKLFAHMASGVPIVASDLPSIREIVNEESALLVKPDDAQALVEGIRFVLSQKEEAKEMAKKAKLDVAQFTWEKRGQNLVKILNS